MEVEYHSKAKDWLLNAWLDVCVKVKKGGTIRDTVLVDLYAGDGLNETTLPDGSRVTWPGSSVRMAVAARQDPRHRTRVIVNEKDPDNYAALVKRVEPHRSLVTTYNEDAAKALPDILSDLVPHDHNFFFVDPFRHSDANIELLRTIGSLAEHDTYRGESIVRRPEILYTFMTSGMQLSLAEQAQSSIDRFYGGIVDWRMHFQEAEENGLPAYDGFLAALLTAMRDQFPTRAHNLFEVKSPKGPIVYFLVFWATHPLAQKIFPDVSRYAYRHRDEDVIRLWIELKERVRALGRKGKGITEWS